MDIKIDELKNYGKNQMDIKMSELKKWVEENSGQGIDYKETTEYYSGQGPYTIQNSGWVNVTIIAPGEGDCISVDTSINNSDNDTRTELYVNGARVASTGVTSHSSRSTGTFTVHGCTNGSWSGILKKGTVLTVRNFKCHNCQDGYINLTVNKWT